MPQPWELPFECDPRFMMMGGATLTNLRRAEAAAAGGVANETSVLDDPNGFVFVDVASPPANGGPPGGSGDPQAEGSSSCPGDGSDWAQTVALMERIIRQRTRPRSSKRKELLEEMRTLVEEDDLRGILLFTMSFETKLRA